ncbi:MAG: cyclic pyranopterin monophosphate synthase MoaC [Thalassotalea sp.]
MLTHVNEQGQANMVDVTDKNNTVRIATAQGTISMNSQTIAAIKDNSNKKGDVIATARIAGIQAAKKCADLIPLCHPLALTKVELNFDIDESSQLIHVTGMCKLTGKTGVEMEALTAVSVALLTLFDMCKASDPLMEMSGIKVIDKQGGKTGHWQRSERDIHE